MSSVLSIFQNRKRDTKKSYAHVLCTISLTPRATSLKISRYIYNQTPRAVHMRWAGPATWAGLARWGNFHPVFIWNFLSYCKKLVASPQKDCFDHVAFKRKILYFQYGFQKAATISFYCIQYYEYDTAFSILLQLHGILPILVLLILDFTYLVVLVVAILKSNLERIPKHTHAL